MSTETFYETRPEMNAIVGAEAPNAFVNADSRTGVVAGKNSLTVSEAALQLLRNEPGWGGAFNSPFTVTYGFRDTAPSTMPADVGGFSQFNAAQILQAEKALQSWSDVANITFVRVGEGSSGEAAYSNNAAILFANYSTGDVDAAAFAYYPGSTSSTNRAGDVWVNATLSYNLNPTSLNYGGMVLTHELGHAIGIAHPSEYDSASSSPTYAANALYYEDSRQYTVMSYFGESNTGGAFNGAYAVAPLLDDIAAAQLAYGANMTTRTGDTVYGFNSNAGRDWFSAASSSSKLVFAAWDAGGTDTFDFSGYRTAQTIDLRQGFFSSVGGLTGNVTIAMGATIENAIGGSGNDTINGNAAMNRLTGGQGNDRLDGGQGLDTAVYAGGYGSFAILAAADGGWSLRDNGSNEGVDTVLNVETLKFSDREVSIVDSRVALAMANVLRLATFSTGAEAMTKSLAASIASGTSYTDAISTVTKAAISTSAVAVLSYQFFTGKTPSSAGMDYLVSPNGANPNNLNSAYYQSFNVENRYINFAVNLGKIGEGAASFTTNYGSLTLAEATKKAYATIFGLTPTDAKVADLLGGSLSLNGATVTRADYFALYGQDGLNGQGTKAAMVGWLMAEAEKADIGLYAKSADAFFQVVTTDNIYGIDLIGLYGKPEYNLI